MSRPPTSPLHTGVLAIAALRQLADLALPAECGGCGEPGASWCASCGRAATGALFAGGPRRVRPEPCPPGLPRTWALGPYAGPWRAALVAFKDADRRDLGVVLAPALACSLARAVADVAGLPGTPPGDGECRDLVDGVLVVPVPSSRSARRRRGDAPLEQVARAAVRLLTQVPESVGVRSPLPGLVLAPALRLRRRVADQAGLDRRRRAANLEGAMEITPVDRDRVRSVRCVLVDDVLTTGATLSEAARALAAAGAGPVTAAAIVATRRRRPA